MPFRTPRPVLEAVTGLLRSLRWAAAECGRLARRVRVYREQARLRERVVGLRVAAPLPAQPDPRRRDDAWTVQEAGAAVDDVLARRLQEVLTEPAVGRLGGAAPGMALRAVCMTGDTTVKRGALACHAALCRAGVGFPALRRMARGCSRLPDVNRRRRCRRLCCWRARPAARR